MNTRADLNELWNRLEPQIRERFRMFPHVPFNDGAVPEAEWPEPTVDGLLDFAASIGIPVIYAAASRLDDLDGAMSDLLGEAEEEDEEKGLAARLRAHRGGIKRIEVAFVHQGVLHRWEAEADWLRELESMAEARDVAEEADLGGALGPRREPEVDPAQMEQWARLLAEDPAFQRAKTSTGREREARRLIPEIDRAISESERGHSFLAYEVIRTAHDLYWEEVVPRLDQEMAPQARSLLAQGLRKYQAAARLKISVDRLNRILEQFPEDM